MCVCVYENLKCIDILSDNINVYLYITNYRFILNKY